MGLLAHNAQLHKEGKKTSKYTCLIFFYIRCTYLFYASTLSQLKIAPINATSQILIRIRANLNIGIILLFISTNGCQRTLLQHLYHFVSGCFKYVATSNFLSTQYCTRSSNIV